jgi:uncharacterized protein (TIGR04255 family)
VADNQPKFHTPPVVETALSVQFANLAGYSTAHAGWFWKEYLEKLEEDPSRRWVRAVDAPRLEDQFERFGTDDIWGPQIQMKMLSPTQSHRTQIIRADNERMLQVQDSRFILNWKKQSGAYPKFGPLLEEFRTLLRAFEAFAFEAGLGTLKYNQWEIAYVDQLKKGGLWESARDWGKIFPGLSMPPSGVNQVLWTGDETMSADWRFSLTGHRGRMYISLRQVKIQPANDEVLNITFVSRGPVTPSETWEQGFDIGHEVLYDTFLAVTSPEAKQHWKEKV